MEKHRSDRNHGMSATRLYGIWKAMKQRCYDKNCKGYKWYGARGITVCDEWLHDFPSFHKWSVENGYKESAPRSMYTLDREDKNGDYSPNNCRWVGMTTQSNNRRDNHIIEYHGVEYTLADAERCFGIPQTALRKRLRNGWEVEKAIETPLSESQMYSYDGNEYTLTELSKIVNIPVNTLRSRLRYGWTLEEALNKPINPPRHKKGWRL